DYGTVQYFGVSVFTTGIFRTWFGLGDSIAAAQLATLLLAFVLIMLGLERYSRRQARFYHASERYAALEPMRLRGGAAILALLLCALPVVFGFVLPAGVLLFWTLQSWQVTVTGDFVRLALNSLGLAALAAMLALLLGLFFVYVRRLHDNFFTRASLRVVSMGYAVPGTVIAVGALLPFAWFDNALDSWLREQFGVSSGLLLSGTLFVLVFAYLVRFLALSVNTLEAGLDRVRPSMDETARTLGSGRLHILQRIHMPMLRGSLLTAVLLVFVDVLKELPATLLLRPFNFNTLAVRTYELANDERLLEAAPSALMIILVGILPVIVLSRIISRSRPGQQPQTQTPT
ncbi:MAG: ABC transporter permease subunit, partial [Gammaproteobacteria bacterium]